MRVTSASYCAFLFMAILLTGSALAESIGTGTVEGTFLSPNPGCPPATCSGIGTSTFLWGDPAPEAVQSQLNFTGGGFDTAVGERFVLGSLSYRNGSTFSNIDTVDLHLGTNSPDPGFAQATTVKVALVNTPNLSADPRANADFLYFRDFPQFGSLRVYEGAAAEVQLVGAFGPNSLDFLGFGALAIPPDQGQQRGFPGWLSPGVEFMGGVVGPESSTGPVVPEPSGLLLVGSGIAAFGLLRKRWLAA